MDSRRRSFLLSVLGSRVRELRRARGYSRAELAARAGLSPRFLARVEGGAGNISMVRLDGLAAALGVSAEELIRSPGASSGVVALVGTRGAGKSTVGASLAARLALPFLELDEKIREVAGLPVDQIFELHGESYYRRLERRALEDVLQRGEPLVLATGGGIVHESSTWDSLLRGALVVWLKARAEDHWNRVVAQGDRRPMRDHPDAMAELRAILASREPLYARAHLTVDTHGLPPERIVDTILQHLERTGYLERWALGEAASASRPGS